MVKFSPSLFVLGFILLALGAAMLLTAAFAAFMREAQVSPFLSASFVTLFAGGAFIIANRQSQIEFSPREAFLLTTMAWVGACTFGALPFLLSADVSYADAFFETMSGLTTTGSTIFVGLDAMPKSVLLWRALLNWMGGVGIVVMAIAILPFLRIGGMQLFKSESSDKSEKVLPRPGQVAGAIVQVYLILTAACAISYSLAGMNGFDAVCHAMATLATGGFSTSDLSFAKFEAHSIHWIATLFMFLGGCPFLLFVQMFQRRPFALLLDPQVQLYFSILFVASLATAIWISAHSSESFIDALRISAFNLTSILTTTGFALGDYTLWGAFPILLVFLFTFTGACSGSTAGGIKVFRFQVIWIAFIAQMRRMIHPHAVVPRQYQGTRLSEEVIGSILMFTTVYLLSVAAISLGLAALGAEFTTAISGAATAVGNVGLGLGATIGPAGNFIALNDAQVWLLSLGMLLGRLELMTVYVLLLPSFWRN
ncbi:MAG: TrkH family potassium uptake protein [Alphaproteobacteria bacterium]|nr:TrkH family potassium uptake protein [Alphaproteobacteria bacterium]